MPDSANKSTKITIDCSENSFSNTIHIVLVAVYSLAGHLIREANFAIFVCEGTITLQKQSYQGYSFT